MAAEPLPIWDDPDVQRIYDVGDGQPFPRFYQFNDNPGQLKLVSDFVMADQAAGADASAQMFLDACLAGVRAVEALDGQVDPGWIKFFIYQVDQNNYFLWDRHQRASEVAAIGEWTVTTIHGHGWGPDGNATPLGQTHSYAMALAAQAGGGVRLNPATNRMEYGDGSLARHLAGVPRSAS